MKRFLLTTTTEVRAENEWDAQIHLLYLIAHLKEKDFSVVRCALEKTKSVD